MKCAHCGTENEPDDRFCEQCGMSLHPDEPAELSNNGHPAPSERIVPSTLIRLDGAQHESFSLGSRAVIGRLGTCDLPVDDRSVSREHARLSRLRDGYVVEDLGSTNGTLVNSRRIDEAVILRPGDILTVGSVDFRFEQYPVQEDKSAASTKSAWLPRSSGGHAGAIPAHADSEEVKKAPSALPEQAGEIPDAEGSLEDAAGALPGSPLPDQVLDIPARAQSSTQEHAEPSTSTDSGVDRHAGPAANDSVDLAAVLDTSSSLGEMVRALVAELEATRRRLETDQALLEHSRSQIQDMQAELTAAHQARDAAETEAQASMKRASLKDGVLEVLSTSPDAAMSDLDADALRELLDALASSPRDIGVLMNLAEHAAEIRQVVDVAHGQRQVLDKIRERAEAL